MPLNYNKIREEKGLASKIKIKSSTLHDHTWYKEHIGEIFYTKKPHFDAEFVYAYNEKGHELGTVHKDDFEWISQ
jgi:hypothetical protein